MQRQISGRWAIAMIALCALSRGALAETDPSLEAAAHGAQRTPSLVARDIARHPVEELSFFGLKPNQTVVEIWPSGGYWTEILAPYLHDHGTYYAAILPDDSGNASIDASNAKFRQKLAADAAVYGAVKVTNFGKDHGDIAPPGSADLVVTFRNLHNWMKDGYGDQAFVAFFKALKPGGILGVEEHRGRPDKPQDPEAASGYVRQDYAIQLAQKAGFVLLGSSEINANPKDTTNWPKGVWTLPPTLALGDQDRAVYEAIGEADNFVLKFQKPAR